MHFTKKERKSLKNRNDKEEKAIAIAESFLNKNNEDDLNKKNNFEKLKSKLDSYVEKASNLITEISNFVFGLNDKLRKHSKVPNKKTLFQVSNIPKTEFKPSEEIPKTTEADFLLNKKRPRPNTEPEFLSNSATEKNKKRKATENTEKANSIIKKNNNNSSNNNLTKGPTNKSSAAKNATENFFNFSSKSIFSSEKNLIKKKTRRENKISISFKDAEMILDQSKWLKKSFAQARNTSNKSQKGLFNAKLDCNANCENSKNKLISVSQKNNIEAEKEKEQLNNPNENFENSSFKLFFNYLGSMSKTNFANTNNLLSFSPLNKMDYLLPNQNSFNNNINNNNFNFNLSQQANSFLFPSKALSPSFPGRDNRCRLFSENDYFTSNFFCSQMKLKDSINQYQQPFYANDIQLFSCLPFVGNSYSEKNNSRSSSRQKSLLFYSNNFYDHKNNYFTNDSNNNLNSNNHNVKSNIDQVSSLIINKAVSASVSNTQEKKEFDKIEDFKLEENNRASYEFFNFNYDKGEKRNFNTDICESINKKDYDVYDNNDDSDHITFNPKFLSEEFAKGSYGNKLDFDFTDYDAKEKSNFYIDINGNECDNIDDFLEKHEANLQSCFSNSEKKEDQNKLKIITNRTLNEFIKCANLLGELHKMEFNLEEFNEIIVSETLANDLEQRRSKKYKMFPSEFKKKCIELCKKSNLKTVSKSLKVPVKSLKRWFLVGTERKKGGGRKIKDPEMEKKLSEWIHKFNVVEGNPITAKIVKKKALEFRSSKEFIASKGWLEKFKRKYNLNIISEKSLRKNRENKVQEETN